MSYGQRMEALQRAMAAGLDGHDRPYPPGTALPMEEGERTRLIVRLARNALLALDDVEREQRGARRGGGMVREKRYRPK